MAFYSNKAKYSNTLESKVHGDVFVHDHIGLDDCAYGMGDRAYEEAPLAKVHRKTYIGRAQFYELSIFHDSLELLVCGGFFFGQDQIVLAYLGSSPSKWNHGEMESHDMYVSGPYSLCSTHRLLNDYAHRDANRLWGFPPSDKVYERFFPGCANILLEPQKPDRQESQHSSLCVEASIYLHSQ
ncbi:hypothetical protein BCV71DRAFT_264342 [Rhizopus microsporus]|uniref:Uncharacterized protein n=2 Tax=Rhizopus TaxID=4842 RepID=A0A1X0S0S3_RHIZD|nr:hypothetical protein BCV71DRAFT_264342 [Rhizopus microsporus]